jgi:hypothetical protein
MTDSASPRLDADIKTLDGITLRGWLFPATSRGPAMIMTPGVTTYLTFVYFLAIFRS